ncbi:MAG: hypothetical protein HAW66_07285 [Shewanella sp.]|nr:hypothetical protein [Shewanella sp.]
MNFEEAFELELQAIETSIISVYRNDRNTFDTQVERALNSVMTELKSQLKNSPIKSLDLSGADLALYDAISNSCKLLLNKELAISIDDLIKCLKVLRKSVQRWNKKFGRQGYLNFVANFV